MPVSGSISTSQICVPFGQLGPSTSPSESTDSRAPSSFFAISNRLMRLSVPTTVSQPSRYSISSTEVSSTLEAFSRALLIMSLLETATAVQPTNSARAPAGPFDIAGEAAAVEQALLLRRFLARGEAIPIRKFGGARQHVREGAGIVHLPDRIGVRQLRGLDVVHLADAARVHADLPRGGIHQPLDDEYSLGPTGAAIGADRRGVGHHR